MREVPGKMTVADTHCGSAAIVGQRRVAGAAVLDVAMLPWWLSSVR
jgi:hypothetical protein